jgi:TolA-binding protein
MKQLWWPTWLCLAVLALSGCNGSKADELLETAQFEEKQNNRDHARQLYEEILRGYPQSEAARKAQERLDRIKADR